MSTGKKPSGSLMGELKRRSVFRTCFLYLVLCWLALQASDIVAPALGYDEDLVSRYLLYLAVLGFPVTFVLAWFFRFTRNGIQRIDAFVERRVLSNIPPVNDRRRRGESNYFRKGEGDKPYRWTVEAETGPLSGLSFGITGPVILGRALDCDLAIITPQVSLRHARLEVIDGNLHVEDLRSDNGTALNGEMTRGRQRLRHDDELRFHDIIFRVCENVSRSGSERALDKTTLIQTPTAGDS
jgi:hypothetical protein